MRHLLLRLRDLLLLLAVPHLQPHCPAHSGPGQPLLSLQYRLLRQRCCSVHSVLLLLLCLHYQLLLQLHFLPAFTHPHIRQLSVPGGYLLVCGRVFSVRAGVSDLFCGCFKLHVLLHGQLPEQLPVSLHSRLLLQRPHLRCLRQCLRYLLQHCILLSLLQLSLRHTSYWFYLSLPQRHLPERLSRVRLLQCVLSHLFGQHHLPHLQHNCFQDFNFFCLRVSARLLRQRVGDVPVVRFAVSDLQRGVGAQLHFLSSGLYAHRFLLPRAAYLSQLQLRGLLRECLS